MEFPEELFLHILVRLPIKDIWRFKGVCKSWFRLISDPFFTNFYAENSPFTILIRAPENCSVNENFSLFEITENGEFTQIPVFTGRLNFCISVIGSWDSSVFLLHHKWSNGYAFDKVYLFNPVLGTFFKVKENYREDRKWFDMEYKVGYIPSNNTYKLFRYTTYRDSYKKDAAKVLTVGLDKKWRNMDASLCHAFWRHVLCLNGAYHWVSEEACDDMICTFDLLEEKNGTGIPMPHGVSRRISLTLLNRRCLSVIDQADDDTMVIWSMKEYGVMESWSKVTVLKFRNPYPKVRYDPYFLPIAVFPNGNILLIENSSKGIFICSQEEKRLTQIEFPDPDHSSNEFYVDTYAPRFYALKVGAKYA